MANLSTARTERDAAKETAYTCCCWHRWWARSPSGWPGPVAVTDATSPATGNDADARIANTMSANPWVMWADISYEHIMLPVVDADHAHET